VQTTPPLWTRRASPRRSRIRHLSRRTSPLRHRSASPRRRPCLLRRRNERPRSMICRLRRRCARPRRRICCRWFSTWRPLCRLWTKTRTTPSRSCQVRPAYHPHRSHAAWPAPWPRPAHRVPARRAPPTKTRSGFRVLGAVTASERHRGCPRRHRRRGALPRGGLATRRRRTGRDTGGHTATRSANGVAQATARMPRRSMEGRLLPRVATRRRAGGSRQRRTASLVERDRRTGSGAGCNGRTGTGTTDKIRRCSRRIVAARSRRGFEARSGHHRRAITKTITGLLATQCRFFLPNMALLITGDHRTAGRTRTIAVRIKCKNLPRLAATSTRRKLCRSLERTGEKAPTAAGRVRCKNLPKSAGTVSPGNFPERTARTISTSIGRIRRCRNPTPTSTAGTSRGRILAIVDTSRFGGRTNPTTGTPARSTTGTTLGTKSGRRPDPTTATSTGAMTRETKNGGGACNRRPY
jgi:hypothetical protein